MTRKDLIISVLIALCLTVVVFPYVTKSQTAEIGEYDPWIDYNDDGKIDHKDLLQLAAVYGTSGTPINKTALLLELLDRVEALEASGSVTTDRIADGAVTNTKLAPFAIPLTMVDTDSSASTTSTTFVDMPGMIATITVDRPSILLIMFSANAWNTDPWRSVNARALVNGTSAKPYWIWLTENRETKVGIMANTFNFYALVPSGAHTVKIQWKVTGGTAESLMRSLIVVGLPT